MGTRKGRKGKEENEVPIVGKKRRWNKEERKGEG